MCGHEHPSLWAGRASDAASCDVACSLDIDLTQRQNQRGRPSVAARGLREWGDALYASPCGWLLAGHATGAHACALSMRTPGSRSATASRPCHAMPCHGMTLLGHPTHCRRLDAHKHTHTHTHTHTHSRPPLTPTRTHTPPHVAQLPAGPALPCHGMTLMFHPTHRRRLGDARTLQTPPTHTHAHTHI
jgi:hypothetical protein